LAKYTLAFAGDGESSEKNIKDLLNDFLRLGPEDDEGYPVLPEDLDVRVILPLTDSHVTNSVMGVFDYLEYADLGYDLVVEKDAKQSGKDAKALLKYAENTDEVDAANPAIIDVLAQDKAQGRDARLILFWGEEGSKDAEILLDLASSADIPANDITAGLDDLSFNEPEPEPAPEPEPDPEPEPEERPRRRRGRAREAQEEAPKALEDEPEKDPEPEPEKPARRRGRARTEETAPEPEVEEKPDTSEPEVIVVDDTPEETEAFDAKARADAVSTAWSKFEKELHANLPDSREKGLAITNAEQGFLWALNCLGKVAAHGEAQKAVETPSRGRGRPRKDGADPQPRTAAQKARTEIWNEETEEWEPKGRGRVPKGAKTRLVDPKTGDVVED
jgi:hypothetical protein